MLNPPLATNVRQISWCLRSQFISASRDAKNSILRLNGRIPNYSTPWQRTQLSAYMIQSQLSTNSFQNPQIIRTISSGHDVIHTPVPFPVWGFIMTMVIVITFVREHKTVPNDYGLNYETRIVQSLTKLNICIYYKIIN